MQQITFVPGAIATPNPITIPAGVAGIDDVVGAVITRLPSGLADHVVHSHPLAFSAGAAGATIVTGAALLSASSGAQVVGAGGAAGDGVRDNATAQAHAGASPVVAAVPLKVTERTFSLDVSTLVGDLLTLVYMERGARLRPA